MDTTTTTTTATTATPLPPIALSTSFQDFLASESDSLDSFHGLAFLAPLNPLHNQRISSAAFAQSFLPSSSPTHSSMSLSASSLSASSAYAYTSLNNCDFPSLNLNFSLPHESSSENLYGFDSSLDFSQSLNNDIPTTPNFPSRENSNSSSSDNNSLSPLSDTTSPTLTPPNSAEEYILSNVDDLLEDQLRPQQTGSLAAPAVAGHSSCKEEPTPTMAMALRVNPITAKVLVSTHSTASSSSSSSSSSSASSSSNSMSMNAKPILSQSGKRKKRAAPSDDEDKEEFPSPKSECSVEEEKECKKSCLPRGLLYHADAHVHDRPPNKFLEFCPPHRAWNALDYEGIFYIGLSTKVNGSNITALKSETLKSGITWRQPFTLLSPSVAAKGYTLFILGVGSKLRPAYVAKLKGKIRFEQSLPSEAKCRRCRLKAEVLEWTLLDQGEDREAATFHQQLENVLRGKEANSAPASRAKKQRNERTAVSTLVDENEDKNDVTVNEELLAFHAHMQLALRPPAPPPPSSSSSSSSVSAPSHGSSHELMSFSEYYSRLLKLFLVFHVYAHSNAVSLRSLATALHLDDCVDDQQLFMRLATALQQLQLQGQSMYENWQQMRSFELLAELMAQHLRTQAVTLDQIRTYHRQANIILRTQAQGRRVCRNWLGGCYHRMAVGDSELCAECSVQYQQQQPAAQQRLPAIFLFARNVQTSDSVLWQEMWNPERHTQFAIFAFAAANNIWMRRWSASECDSDELLMIAFNPMRGVDSTPFDGCGAVYALVDIALHAVNVMTSSTSGSGILAAVEQSERRLLSLAEFQSLARAQQFFSYRQSQPLHQFSQSTSASSSSSSSFPHSGHANENAIDDGGQMATVNATAMTLVQVNNEDVGVSGGHEDGSQQLVQRRVQGAAHDNQAITDITVLEPHGSVPLLPINNRVTQLVEPQQANLLNTQAQNRFTFQIQRNSMEDEGTENNPEIRQREQYYQQMQSMLSQARRSATNTHAASTANGNDEHYASQTAGSQQPRLFSAVNVEESNGSLSTSLSSSASTHMVEVGSASGHAQFQSSFAVQSESDVSHSTNAADRHHQQLSAPLQLPISRIEFSPWPHYDSHAHNQIHRSRRFQSLTQLQVAEFSATSDAQQIPQLSLAPTPLQPQMHIQTQISPAQTQQEMLSSETRTLSVSYGFASDSDSDSVSRMNVSLSQTESSDIPRAQQDSGPLENRGSSGVGQRHSSRSSAAGNHSGNFLGAGVSSEPSTAGSGIGVGAILTQLALVTSWFSSKAEQSLALLLVLVSSSLVQQQAAEPQMQQIHHLPPLSDNHAQILLTPTHSHTDGDLQSSFSQSHNPQSFQHTQTDPDIQQSIRFQSADVSWITSEQMYSLHTQQPPALHSNMFSITPQRISSSRANESSSQSSSARAISANALTWLAAAVSWFSVQAKQSAAIFVVVLSTAAQQQQQRSQQQSNSAHGHVPFTNANAASTRMSMQNPDSREERSQLQSQLEAQSASEQWQQSSSHSASQSSGEHLQKKKEPRNKQSEQENRIYEEYRLPEKAGTVTKHWAQSLQSAVNNSETVSAQILALAQNSQTRKPQNSADTIRGRGTMSLQRALKLLIAALKRAKISTVSVHDDEQCFASEISDQLTVDDRTHSDGFERQRVEEDSDFNNVHCAFDRNPWQTSVCAAVA